MAVSCREERTAASDAEAKLRLELANASAEAAGLARELEATAFELVRPDKINTTRTYANKVASTMLTNMPCV